MAIRFHMSKIIVLLMVLALGFVGMDNAEAGGGGCAPTTVDDYKFHNIIDHTSADHLNVWVSNTETVTGKQYPLSGACPNPQAGVDASLFPTVGAFTPPTPVSMYVEVKINNADLVNAGLTSATINTCNQNDFKKCPGTSNVPNTGLTHAAEGDVPTTYVYRLGSENGSGTVTALNNTAIDNPNTPGVVDTYVEPLNNMFTVGGQAFDLDRLRYVANRLWWEYRQDVESWAKGSNGTTGWWQKTGFWYQATGTMSFENFLWNVQHNFPMYGIVRVVVPVDMGTSEAQYDPARMSSWWVGGFEHYLNALGFSPPTWRGISPAKPNEMWSYEGSADAASSKTITVYGMLLIDYVDAATYDPDNFFDANQDYIDNFLDANGNPDLAAHDAASHAGKKNFILPRTTGRNVYIKNWDTLNINAVNDLESFVFYTDTPVAGGDGRMDTLDIVRRKYMMGGSKSFAVGDVSDAAVWEYWMRKAAKLPAGSSVRTTILSDLATQYNIDTQVLTGTRRASYDTTEWTKMTDAEKFHAFFPNGYERGWAKAFDFLDLATLDGANGAGWWWSHLADDTTGQGGASFTKGYDPLGVPDVSKTNLAMKVDADGDGTADVMPNFFTTGWEDFPALAFAGGVLDVHGHANVSGMLYTPDSAEIEAKSEKPAVFQYMSGAMLFGNGVILEGKKSQHSMIAVSFNYNSFDKLRGGGSQLTVLAVSNLREFKGQ